MEEKTYMPWEMKEGKITKVKIENDVFEIMPKKQIDKKEKAVELRPTPVEMKECNGCRKTKTLSQFYIKKNGKPYPRCKKCWAKDAHDMYVRRKTKQKTGKGFKMYAPDVKEGNVARMKERLKAQYPAVLESDILCQPNKRGNVSILFKKPKKILVEKMTNKPEVGISDGTSEDAFPLVDSGGVMKDQVDEKTKRKWPFFKSK